MKDILICGIPRSGKTTLAKMLCQKFNYNFYSVDTLVSTFQKVYPQLDISHKDGLKTSELFAPFLHEYLSRLQKFRTTRFVVEGYHMFPKDLSSFVLKDNFEIVYLGYPSLSPQQIVESIRKYDTDADWTKKKSDVELFELAELFNQRNILFQKDCKKYGFQFFDVGIDREKTLAKIEKMLTKDEK